MTATLENTGTDAAAGGGIGEIPSFDVTLRIRRYSPESHGDEAYWQEFTVTVHGKPSAVLMSLEDFASYEETRHLLRSPANAERQHRRNTPQ